MSKENGSDSERRRPAAFSLDAEQSGSGPAAAVKAERQAERAAAERRPRSFDEPVELTDIDTDPFEPSMQDLVALEEAKPAPRRFSFLKLAVAAFSILFSMAIGIWIDDLVRALFERADWLGYAALGVLGVGLAALLAFAIREYRGIARLEAVQHLKLEAAAAAAHQRTPEARALVERLTRIVAHRPEATRGIAALAATKDDIIDAPHLLALAERELLTPLDARARLLILNAAKRVSVVTAVSPRAVVDLVYVFVEALRLVRAMAELYGGRPGGLGQIRLLRDVIAHLAVTGSIAMGDSIVQQVLGHGLASRLSARLGEGVINGLMTARIGIAAMDLCRPLPFVALKRPGIGDFMGDITAGATGRNGTDKS